MYSNCSDLILQICEKYASAVTYTMPLNLWAVLDGEELTIKHIFASTLFGVYLVNSSEISQI